MSSDTIANVLNATAQVGMFIVVALGVWVAHRQLGVWRDERIATKRAELGEELVSLVTELRGEISLIRSSFGYQPANVEDDDGTYDFRRRLGELAKLDEVFSRLRHAKVRSTAYFSDDVLIEALGEFFEARKKLIVGLRGMIRQMSAKQFKYGRELSPADIARIERYEAIIWEGYGEEADPIESALRSAETTITRKMLPHIRLEVKP